MISLKSFKPLNDGELGINEPNLELQTNEKQATAVDPATKVTPATQDYSQNQNRWIFEKAANQAASPTATTTSTTTNDVYGFEQKTVNALRVNHKDNNSRRQQLKRQQYQRETRSNQNMSAIDNSRVATNVASNETRGDHLHHHQNQNQQKQQLNQINSESDADTIMHQANINHEERRQSTSSSSSSSSISIVVVSHNAKDKQNESKVFSPNMVQCSIGSVYSNTDNASDSNNSSTQPETLPNTPAEASSAVISLDKLGKINYDASSPNEILQAIVKHGVDGSGAGNGDSNNGSQVFSIGEEHFEIIWSNLSYKIEPKWYKKINFVDKIFSHLMPGQTMDNHSSATSTASSSAGMNDNQHQMHTSANADRHLQQQLNLQQRSPSDQIQIFKNLNGTIKSGQMTAVLGPSGAGKTTLLNCLTGKLRKGVSGHINLMGANGKRLKMCTIPQKDHLLELLTVEENLWFASKIKNPEYGFDHVKNIERVIDLLGLKRCRSAKIKKISGGQHKRVSIAQELLSNPDILVLDEPTSGLDSLTCFKTISMLRDLVELSASNDFMKPMAIIVTIHQPQPKVFNLFHHVYILANGGRVIYEGSPHLSMNTITSVTDLRPEENIKASRFGPSIVDPASFLIEIASEEYGLEPIKILSDYHSRMFNEKNHSKYIYNQDNRQHHNNLANFQLQTGGRGGGGEKNNLGFSPDYEHGGQQVYESNINFNRINKTNSNDNNESQQNQNCELNNTVHSVPGSGKIKRRKKSAYSLESSSTTTTTSGSSSYSADSGQSSENSSCQSNNNLYMSEQLRHTQENDHTGRFWSHTAALTHRTLLTTRRDPLLMTSRVLFHLMIPILMAHVYGKATGAANACPNYEPEIDITQIPSLVEGKRIEYMLEELHMSIENVSMFFIIMYAFAAAVLALNALSFPLNMQVLLKETRNGWYSMSSYVVAKTLADLPLELTMPTLTMALVYPLTGQPSSYLQWRMLTICLIMTLCSLIAQTQALILGALVMNSVQTAVFVSQASQLPWVILAGFTIRIKRLSEPLKLISLTSFYRLGCEAITLTRYGFGICPCDPQEITGEPVKLVGIPDQLRTLAQYWIDSMNTNKNNNDTSLDFEDAESRLPVTTTTLAPGAPKNDIFQHLANQLSYANSYGVNITSCDDVAPDRIRAINLNDSWLVARIWHLLIMLIIMKFLLYYAVRFSIGIRL